jgi:hypothetical protein
MPGAVCFLRLYPRSCRRAGYRDSLTGAVLLGITGRVEHVVVARDHPKTLVDIRPPDGAFVPKAAIGFSGIRHDYRIVVIETSDHVCNVHGDQLLLVEVSIGKGEECWN